MSLLESLKHLPEDLAAAIRRATESGDAEVSVEPGLEIKIKLVIRPGSSGDDLDLDGKSLEELEELLGDLQRELDIVLGDEPEDEDSASSLIGKIWWTNWKIRSMKSRTQLIPLTTRPINS